MGATGNVISAILTNIFTSASKLVFLMIAITVCVAFFSNHLTQENFMWVAQSVLSYYFGKSQGESEAKGMPPRDVESSDLPKPDK